jgi:hypothetical protein
MSEQEAGAEKIEVIQIKGEVVTYVKNEITFTLRPFLTNPNLPDITGELRVVTYSLTKYQDGQGAHLESLDFFAALAAGKTVLVYGEFYQTFLIARRVTLWI